VKSADPITCGDYRCDEDVKSFSNWPHTHAGDSQTYITFKLSVHRCIQLYITEYYESVMTQVLKWRSF
jgi:hypothetical protein